MFLTLVVQTAKNARYLAALYMANLIGLIEPLPLRHSFALIRRLHLELHYEKNSDITPTSYNNWAGCV